MATDLDQMKLGTAAGSHDPVMESMRGKMRGKRGGPGRRTGFERIARLAALALEMPQDAIDDARFSNNRDHLHFGAAGTQQGVNLERE